MQERKKRLAHLVTVQRQLQAVHEMRHASHVAHQAAARREAEELSEQADRGGGLADLFPDLVARRVGKALAREEDHRAKAAEEARHIVAWSVRGDTTERAFREASRAYERHAEEKDRQEAVTRPKR